MSFSKNSKHSTTVEKPSRKERFHSNLSDVGLYCLGGLCAVSLSQLFNEECQMDFKKKALEKILLDLGQPKQTNESMFALLEGEIMENSNAFVDSLMIEECLKDGKQLLITDLISLAISDGCYDARMRVLIKHVAWQLRVTWNDVESIEEELSEHLEYDTYVMSEQEMKEKAKKSRNTKVKRYALIGLATVGGGALIGLTGGLAAPLVAAGAGAIIGGAGAAALGSVAGVAIIGSLFGVAGAGLTGYKMKRRVGAVDEFSFEPLTLIGSRLDSARTVKQLHVTIAVTGWINDKIQDFRLPWSALAESKEQYSLRWESRYLYQMGEAFDYLLQTGLSVATTEALKYTILSGILTAVAWPAALISAAGAIDNPWHVCTQRALEAGKQLAEVLLSREQGNRPVTLIGFSLGSRVIFSCLEELAKRTGGEGLIEDVILLGAPVSGDPKYWKPLTKVVAGKIVNGYARGDWLLKFLYRTASVTFRVAGLSPVKWDNRRMHNIDLSDVIDGHGDYIKNLGVIMKAVGVRTKDELNISYKKPVKTPSAQKEENHKKTDGDNEKVEKVNNKAEAKDGSENCDSGKLEAANSNNEIEGTGNEPNKTKADITKSDSNEEQENMADQDRKDSKEEDNKDPADQGKKESKGDGNKNPVNQDRKGSKREGNKVDIDNQAVLNALNSASAIKDRSAIVDENPLKKLNSESEKENSNCLQRDMVPCAFLPEDNPIENEAKLDKKEKPVDANGALTELTSSKINAEDFSDDTSASTGIVCESADEISGFENVDTPAAGSRAEESEGCYFTDSDPESVHD